MIFIIGNPRSGTSLLRLLLTTHPVIHIPPECGFAIWWYQKYQDWSEADLTRRLDLFVEDVVQSKKFEFWNIGADDLRQSIINVHPNDYAALCQSIYMLHAVRHGKEHALLGDKNNFHISHIDTLSALWPEAKFIHIVRDGRDVAASYIKLQKSISESKYKPSLSGNLVDIANEWVDNIQMIKQSLRAVSAERVQEIRYEDLVFQTEPTLQSVCSFLGLEYNSLMLNFHLENQKKSLEPEEFRGWKAKTFQKIDTKSVGQYKKQLTAEEVIEFQTISKQVLRHYDYLS